MNRPLIRLLTVLGMLILLMIVMAWRRGSPRNDQSSAPLLQSTATALVPSPAPLLKDLGAAPELMNTVWLNVDQPLRLSDLKGKVVLLDMWTFG